MYKVDCTFKDIIDIKRTIHCYKMMAGPCSVNLTHVCPVEDCLVVTSFFN